MLNEELSAKNVELYKELVPSVGHAETKAGELVRAVNQIGYRFWNDGDRIGVDYGNETCNAPANFIIEMFDKTDMALIAESMWGVEDPNVYEAGVVMLVAKMVDYIEKHPELKTEKNELDMFDFGDVLEEEEEDEDEENEYSTFEEPWAIYDPD